jgi:hypothetical protein
VLNLLWVLFVAFNVVANHDRLLTPPIIAAFGLSLVHFVVAYRRPVKVPFGRMIGAMVVFMSMQWTVASAVGNAAAASQTSFNPQGCQRPPQLAADAKASGNRSIVTRDDGNRQWVYNRKPLYTWKEDKNPGDVTDDGVNNVWHIAAP